MQTRAIVWFNEKKEKISQVQFHIFDRELLSRPLSVTPSHKWILREINHWLLSAFVSKVQKKKVSDLCLLPPPTTHTQIHHEADKLSSGGSPCGFNHGLPICLLRPPARDRGLRDQPEELPERLPEDLQRPLLPRLHHQVRAVLRDVRHQVQGLPDPLPVPDRLRAQPAVHLRRVHHPLKPEEHRHPTRNQVAGKCAAF